MQWSLCKQAPLIFDECHIIAGEGVESAKLGIAAAMEEEHEAHALKKDLETIERRRWKTDQKLLVDELLPKGTGRQVAQSSSAL